MAFDRIHGRRAGRAGQPRAGAPALPRRNGGPGEGRLPHVLPGRRRRVHARGRSAALLRLRGGAAGLRGRRGEGSRVRDGVLGHRDDLVPPDLGPAECAGAGGGSGRREESPGARCKDRARARLHRRDRRLLSRFRSARSRGARARLQRGHPAAREAVARRSRSADLLCPLAARHGAAGRRDLREPEAGGCDPERPPAPRAAAPRHRALHDPLVRLSAARRRCPPRGPRLLEDCPGLAARPPHALAHLHAARTLAGFDCLEPRVGQGGPRARRATPSRRGLHGYAARARLPRVRLPPDRRRSRGPRRPRRSRRRQIVRRSDVCRGLRAGGDSRALRLGTARLEGRGAARAALGGAALGELSVCTRDHVLRPGDRRVARRRARPRPVRVAAARDDPRRPREVPHPRSLRLDASGWNRRSCQRGPGSRSPRGERKTP